MSNFDFDMPSTCLIDFKITDFGLAGDFSLGVLSEERLSELLFLLNLCNKVFLRFNTGFCSLSKFLVVIDLVTAFLDFSGGSVKASKPLPICLPRRKSAAHVPLLFRFTARLGVGGGLGNSDLRLLNFLGFCLLNLVKQNPDNDRSRCGRGLAADTKLHNPVIEFSEDERRELTNE